MFIDTMLLYAILSGVVWFIWILWMLISLFSLNILQFFLAFALLMLSPVLFELVLNIYGFLTSSSLLFIKHQESWDRMWRNKFPVIYSFDYGTSFFNMEHMHGIDPWLNYYIYRRLEEQEIIDSKYEEMDWMQRKQLHDYARQSNNIAEARRRIEEGRLQNFIRESQYNDYENNYRIRHCRVLLLSDQYFHSSWGTRQQWFFIFQNFTTFYKFLSLSNWRIVWLLMNRIERAKINKKNKII